MGKKEHTFTPNWKKVMTMEDKRFVLQAPYQAKGDQPQAIEQLVAGLKKGYRHQTLLGATGTGKTYAMAAVVEKINKPTLVIAHNKTLAAQLASEFKEFFPDNSVEYLSAIMIIINLRLMFHRQIPISKKILRSMRILTD